MLDGKFIDIAGQSHSNDAASILIEQKTDDEQLWSGVMSVR